MLEKNLWRGRLFRPGTKLNDARQRLCRDYIATVFADRPDLREAVTPTHPFGGKRPVFASTFYPALKQDNVQLVPRAVSSVTRHGIVATDGVERAVDVIVLATGFQPTNYLARLEVVGRRGRTLHEEWAGEPRAYLGITVPGFPNFYMLYGPGTNGGELVLMLESQAQYAVRAVKRMMHEHVTAVEVKPRFEAAWYRWLQSQMVGTSWTTCNNYFKSATGKIVTQWPEGNVVYGALTRLLGRVSETTRRRAGRHDGAADKVGDRRALRALVNAYAHHVDRREHDAVAALFTEDGRLTVSDGDPERGDTAPRSDETGPNSFIEHDWEDPDVADIDFETLNYFRGDSEIHQDPYPYYEWLRAHGPVWRHPRGVVFITGYEEAIAVYHDQATWSNCNTVSGPFFKFSVPLEGDDLTEIIEEHRDELPFSDQLPSFDPPKHTAHRGLLMRLITPKRLKDNEVFMWAWADQTIDEFIGDGECELIQQYAVPFTVMVVADLLGVPAEDRDAFLANLVHKVRADRLEHKPLEYLYEQFTRYIEDRRANPRDDIMTEMAHATFPDGTLPPVEDVMKIAANLFSAGGETTARLITSSFKIIGDRPDLQQRLRDDRGLVSPFIEEVHAAGDAVEGFVQAVTGTHDRRRGRHARGHDGVRDERRREPRPAPVREPEGVPPRPRERAPAPRLRSRHP